VPKDPPIIDRLEREVNGSLRREVRRFAATVVVFLLLACCVRLVAASSSDRRRWAIAVMPRGEEFSLEVAADDASRARGFMFREDVGPREGMIFVFASSERHPFWMKNCRVHLDIIWLDAGFRIVEIAHNIGPCPAEGECPSVQPREPARFVLELAGGTAKKLSLKPNDPIVILSEPSLR